MIVRDNLIAARALIDTPEKWQKGRFRSERKTYRCYCALGALFEVCGTGTDALASCRAALINALPVAWQPRMTARYNDLPSTTHADILSLFDRAIAAQPEGSQR